MYNPLKEGNIGNPRKIALDVQIEEMITHFNQKPNFQKKMFLTYMFKNWCYST